MKYNIKKQLDNVKKSKGDKEIEEVLEEVYADGFDDGECNKN